MMQEVHLAHLQELQLFELERVTVFFDYCLNSPKSLLKRLHGWVKQILKFLFHDPVQNSNTQSTKYSSRRQRQHELLIALINRQEDLELMNTDSKSLLGSGWNENDQARLIDRNRRILERYQSLVRSAITLDALLDSEQSEKEPN